MSSEKEWCPPSMVSFNEGARSSEKDLEAIAGELHTLIPSLVGLTQSSLEEGNQVEVLQRVVRLSS